MVEMETSIYDCPITPGFKRCKGFIDGINPVSLNWEKTFDNVERHEDGTYVLIKTEECGIVVLRNGYYDILQAENKEIVNKYIDIVREVVIDGISQ